MSLTPMQTLASIAVMAVVTFLTRALPFLFFGGKKDPPRIVLYLGRVLPPAVIAMLILYCLRSTTFAAPAGWAPALIAGLFVVVVHLWKHNNLLSILGGTVLYMILVQAVFV